MITIGITTFNRANILKMMSKSFYASDIKASYNIRIYDDASTEYDADFLLELFPNAKTIMRHKKNLGSDGNIRYMYEDFIKSGDEFFFNADSDLIFSKEFMDCALRIIKDTDGILSLFNTKMCPTIKTHGCLTEKEYIGSAGTLFTRERLCEFMEKIKDDSSSKNLDWRWSKYFVDKGYRLYAVTNSLVQHIGVDGYNTSISNMAYGDGFRVDSIENGQILNDVLYIATEKRNANINRKWFAIFPFAEIPAKSRVVIYGAGLVGQDYKKQIELTGYCKCVGVVDRKYYQYKNVNRPQDLKKMNYDYILLSALIDHVIDSMIKDIKDIEENLLNKIVVPSGDKVIRL